MPEIIKSTPDGLEVWIFEQNLIFTGSSEKANKNLGTPPNKKLIFSVMKQPTSDIYDYFEKNKNR